MLTFNNSEDAVRKLFYDINQYDIDEIEYTKMAIFHLKYKLINLNDNIFYNFFMKANKIYEIDRMNNWKVYIEEYISEFAIYKNKNGYELNRIVQRLKPEQLKDIYDAAFEKDTEFKNRSKLIEGLGNIISSYSEPILNGSAYGVVRSTAKQQVYSKFNDILIMDSGFILENIINLNYNKIEQRINMVVGYNGDINSRLTIEDLRGKNVYITKQVKEKIDNYKLIASDFPLSTMESANDIIKYFDNLEIKEESDFEKVI